MEPREFVRFLYPAAQAIEAETGISAAAMIAQAALETGWLRAPVKDRYDGRPAYNLFNLKGQGPAGSVRAFDTEHYRGGRQTVEHCFRAYRSYDESFRDYANLILTLPRYGRAAEVRHDALAFLKELAAAGYANDPEYVQKLESILRRYVWPALAEMEAEAKAPGKHAGGRIESALGLVPGRGYGIMAPSALVGGRHRAIKAGSGRPRREILTEGMNSRVHPTDPHSGSGQGYN